MVHNILTKIDPTGMWVLLAVLIAMVSAVKLQAADAPLTMPPEQNRLKPDQAPTPFSGQEIRRSCPAGRTIKFRIEAPGQPIAYTILSFTGGDDHHTTFESYNMDAEGKQLGEKMTGQNKWVELQAHASFPASQTTIRPEILELSGQKLDCWLYVVQSEKAGHAHESRYWFDKKRPGPPVLMKQTVDGRLVLSMTIVD